MKDPIRDTIYEKMKDVKIRVPSKESLAEFAKFQYPKPPTIPKPIIHDHECDALYFDLRKIRRRAYVASIEKERWR